MKPLLLPIAMRTLQSLIRTQGIGDTFRVYLAAQRDGLDFHLAHIPEDFDEQPREQFDPVYMRQLYDLGTISQNRVIPGGTSRPSSERQSTGCTATQVDSAMSAVSRQAAQA